MSPPRRTVRLTVAGQGDAQADGEEPTGAALTGTPAEIAAGLRAHVDAGAEHIIGSLDPCTEETVAEFAEAVAFFRAG